MDSVLSFLAKHGLTILDALSKVAGIVLVVGLWIAYKQYKQSVQLARTATERESIRMAADQCHIYGTVIVPRIGGLDRKLEAAKSEFIKRSKISFTENQITAEMTSVREEDHRKVMTFFDEITLTLNSIEGFAIFFASNVADDNIGYIECGRTFVRYFETHFALYCLDRREQDFFKATQALFWRWKKRLDAETLVQEHAELQKKITLTRQKINPENLKPAKTLGAE